MHARGAPRTYKEGTCGQRYPMRRTGVCYKYKRVISKHIRTARNGIPAADGAATYIIRCAAYKDEDAVAIALQKWRACVGGCRAGRACGKANAHPGMWQKRGQFAQNGHIAHPKIRGHIAQIRWPCVSSEPKNVAKSGAKNPHKKRARIPRWPKWPYWPPKMRKIPAKWPSAAPLMKSPKTRERQAFRGLPFRKWDVGNRKCAGFHKKRVKGIRESGTLTRGRHSRRTWASAGATAHLSVSLRYTTRLLLRRQGSSPLGRLPDALRVP